jgi:hypothetical protein
MSLEKDRGAFLGEMAIMSDLVCDIALAHRHIEMQSVRLSLIGLAIGKV